jgi:serine/threonine protein kinase/tetratricopeptide (TPR) repeat protein
MSPTQTSERERRLGEVLAALLEAQERGERPDRDEWLARHPEFAAELAEFFDSADRLESVATPLREAVAPPRGDELPFALPGDHGRLGDFRILREVGRGGMGVVYEAEQISLGRRVALKVLPFAATLDPRQLQRFHNEARAAAGLHHTNIVPVHAVGSERGVHYYAMQFIDGRTLAELIAQQRGEIVAQVPTMAEAAAASATTAPAAAQATSAAPRDRAYFRRVAEWGVQAAEALDCAHAVGVVHRDVKPANLMVDTAGRLWVTDFGLAQVQSDSRLTMTGDLVGTLRYMSPEQALAKRVVVDHRTDVYSLGATLYELLTLRPAYGGSDRQELLRQIAFEEPSRLRRWGKAIPAELETIVLKAMEKNPQERYATAKDLADDLRHWLEDRPIRARRPTPARRLIKLARRHKAVVSVGFGVAAAALVVLLLGLLYAAQRERKLRQAAVEKRNVARRAVDKMYSQVAEKLLEQEPQQTQLQREFLEEALRFYQELAQEVGDDPAVQFDVAAAYRRMGSLYSALGRHKESEEAFDKANAMLERLTEQFPARPEYRQELATSCQSLGILLRNAGRFDEAEAATRKAISLNEQLRAEFPDEPAHQKRLADSYLNLGVIVWADGRDRARPREAEEAYRRALRLWEKLTEAFPDEPDYRHSLGGTLSNLGLLRKVQGDLTQARQLVQRAVEEQEAARKLNPRHPQYRLYLCNHLTILAQLLDGAGEAEGAVKVARRAVDVQEKLVADWPDVRVFRRSLAYAYDILAQLLVDRNPKEAESLALRATAIVEQEIHDYPEVAAIRGHMADMQLTLGKARYRAGDWPGALAALQKSLELDAGGSNSCYLFLAMTHWQLGHQKEAREWYGSAVTRLEQHKPNEWLRRVRTEAEALLGGKKVPQSQSEPTAKQLKEDPAKN